MRNPPRARGLLGSWEFRPRVHLFLGDCQERSRPCVSVDGAVTHPTAVSCRRTFGEHRPFICFWPARTVSADTFWLLLARLGCCRWSAGPGDIHSWHAHAVQ